MHLPKGDVCVICGIRGATARDHVPPKGFFKGSKDAALVTAPACAPCNNGASSNDEHMRIYMSMQVGKQTPESSRLSEHGARRSVKRKTALRNQVLGTARQMQVFDEDGRSVVRLAVEVPANLYDAAFSRSVRGLYFFRTARILSPGCQTKVSLLVSQNKSARSTKFFLAFSSCSPGLLTTGLLRLQLKIEPRRCKVTRRSSVKSVAFS